jgi:TetR/AcrR family transcriptional regulator, regulator of cefoperazone and chloramphenicol sensitivity
MSPADAAPHRRPRIDGEVARAKLLDAALRLFGERGFAATSTRDIAEAAGVNLAAIRYYFGDKQGLYRATFTEPLGSPRDDVARYDQPSMGLRESLAAFYGSFLEPLKRGELVRLCMRLHYREMVEPTGVWATEIEQGIRPAHDALLRVLARHLRAPIDAEMHRLAHVLVAPALQVFVAREVIDAITPDLLATPDAIDRHIQRLTDMGQTLVRAEAQRRGAEI